MRLQLHRDGKGPGRRLTHEAVEGSAQAMGIAAAAATARSRPLAPDRQAGGVPAAIGQRGIGPAHRAGYGAEHRYHHRYPPALAAAEAPLVVRSASHRPAKHPTRMSGPVRRRRPPAAPIAKRNSRVSETMGAQGMNAILLPIATAIRLCHCREIERMAARPSNSLRTPRAHTLAWLAILRIPRQHRQRSGLAGRSAAKTPEGQR